MFTSCRKLKKVELPDGITRIGKEAFSDCQLLSDINIPNQLREIGDRAFAGCGKLSSVTFPVTLESNRCGSVCELHESR